MKRLCFLIVLLIFISQFGCEVDHGIAPLPGKLQVEVAFRGTPPEDTQGVYLIVAPQFPPHAINELLQSPNSLPTNQDTVITEIDLPYGEYEAFGLWWYSSDTRSNLADILTMPFSGITGEPLGFTISPEEPVLQRRLRANWSYMYRDASIRGTVYFEGQFPENTDVTAIAAYSAQPQSAVHYLVWLKSIDITIETGVKKHDFVLPVANGAVGYIAVFWLPENAPLYDIQIVSEYMDPENSSEIGKLVLSPDEIVEGIEVTVDWNTIKPVFPTEAQ
ncbi:hypothetical protein ACFL4L_06160 [bacterium]